MTFSDFADAEVGPVARHLYDALVHRLQPVNPLLLRTGVEEGDALYAVLRSLGFRGYRRAYSPVLDVLAFDSSRFAEAEPAAAALGYEFVRLADLELTPDVEGQLYEFHTEVYADTSAVVPATPEQ